jgi:DNA-directed RNA polymerase specialized sigma24 family protein
MSYAMGRAGGLFCMPFTAHDLRYHAEQSYPLLYAYLHRHAQRFLGPLKYDAFEVDTVIGHIVEQLVRLGLFGGGGNAPLTALDHLSDAQFYAFLSRSVRNKAIDRLRKRRLQVSTAAELEAQNGDESDDDPINEAVVPLWGPAPFATPEEVALRIATQQELLNMLKHCIMELSSAPRQFAAVMQELEDVGADALLGKMMQDLKDGLASSYPATSLQHMSQHKDHAHKKLRHCLQQQSTNLAVRVALRLTEYITFTAKNYTVEMRTLVQTDLSEDDVRTGLKILVLEGLLDWNGEAVISCSAAQVKHLSRYYRDE